MNLSNKRAWAIDVKRGTVITMLHVTNFTSNQYGASYGILNPVYSNNSVEQKQVGFKKLMAMVMAINLRI